MRWGMIAPKTKAGRFILANIPVPAMEKKGEQEREGARVRKEALGYCANRQDNRCLPHIV
jgi:hypothetical protein